MKQKQPDDPKRQRRVIVKSKNLVEDKKENNNKPNYLFELFAGRTKNCCGPRPIVYPRLL